MKPILADSIQILLVHCLFLVLFLHFSCQPYTVLLSASMHVHTTCLYVFFLSIAIRSIGENPVIIRNIPAEIVLKVAATPRYFLWCSAHLAKPVLYTVVYCTIPKYRYNWWILQFLAKMFENLKEL